MTSSSQDHQEARAGIEVTRGVWVLPAQGNAFAVETPDGVVRIDTGPGGDKTNEYKSSGIRLNQGVISWEGVAQ